MTAPWLTEPTHARPAARRAALTGALPVIETARLTLRVPRLGDWAVLEPIWTTDQARYIGGPMDPEDGWLDFNQMVASWLLRGFGALTVVRRDDGAVLGLASLDHEWGDPAPELGWLLIREAEGQGYGTEAAAAIAEFARGEVGGSAEIYVDLAHEKSIRVARAVGATDAGRHPADPENVAIYRLHPRTGAER